MDILLEELSTSTQRRGDHAAFIRSDRIRRFLQELETCRANDELDGIDPSLLENRTIDVLRLIVDEKGIPEPPPAEEAGDVEVIQPPNANVRNRDIIYINDSSDEEGDDGNGNAEFDVGDGNQGAAQGGEEWTSGVLICIFAAVGLAAWALSGDVQVRCKRSFIFVLGSNQK